MNYFDSISDGGFIYLANPSVAFASTNCNYNHLYSGGRGGWVYGSTLGVFNLNAPCSFTNITSASQGSLFYSPSSTLQLSITGCTFSCYPTYSSGIVSSNIASGTSTIGGLINVANAISVASSGNTYQNCYNVDNGAIFYLTSTTFTDTGSTFLQN